MNKKFKALGLALALSLSIVGAGLGFSQSSSADAVPTVTTDKTKYSVGEGMVISGTGFTATSPIAISVLRPDHVTDTLPTVTSDTNGSFTTTYQPAVSQPGRFKITATDGTNSVKTAVTEADAIGYDKSGYDKGASSWGTGNQDGYSENDWVQYQYTITGVTGAVPSFNVEYDEQISGVIFIDALSNFRVCVDCTVAGGANSRLADGTPRPSATDGAGGWWAFTPLNINNIYNSGPGTCVGTDPANSPSAQHCFRIDPAAIHATSTNFPASFSSGEHTVTIFYEAHMAASFVWSTGHEDLLNNCPSIYCAAAPTGAVPAGITYGANLYDGWTTTAFKGAGGINGASKHFNLQDQSDGPKGSIALPIPAVTLPTGAITIVKVTNPTPANGVSFPFTSDFGGFTLDTDTSATASSSKTFGSLPAGTFNFGEALPVPSGWELTKINCVTTGGTAGSTFATSTVTGLSTINLVSGGAVTCTYTNAITKVTPTVVTTIHDAAHNATTSVAAGTTVHDSAAVTGSKGTATGNVIFSFFPTINCTGATTTAGTVALNGSGIADPSTAQGPLAVGSYSFKAHYNGDSNYFAADADCEPLTVTKIPSNTATQASTNSTSVAPGASVSDTATITGAFGTPTGTVDFFLCQPSDVTAGGCEGSAGTKIGATKALSSGSATSDSTGTTNTPGKYCWRAVYSGDTNYNGSNHTNSTTECFTVAKLNSSTVTAIHDASHGTVTSVNVGSTVHDSATVSGSGATPTGSVVFSWFLNGACTGAPAATSSSQTLTGGTVDATGFAFTVNTSGSRSFQAIYGGDALYNGSTGDCEPLTINKINSQTVTAIHSGSDNTTDVQDTTLALGSTIHDQATVSGNLGTPTGTVTFQYWTNGTCNSTAADTSGALALSSGVVDATGFAKGPLAAGDYSFKATYSGDGVYNGSVGTCEKVSVGKANLSIATTIHDSAHNATTTVALGSTLHDSAAVTGKVASIALPDVTFYFFDNGVQCVNGDVTGATALNTVSPDGSGIAHPSTSKGPLAAGTYNFMAVVAGNTSYNGATSDCEPFTVNKANSSVVTEIHNADGDTVVSGPVALGSTVHDKATVSGTSFGTPTGSVNFDFYTGSTLCSGDFVTTDNELSMTAGVAHPSSDKGPLAAGSYSFKAHYNGDDNYNASDADCEPFTVSKAQLTVTTSVHNSSDTDKTNGNVPLGSVMHDTATVSGGVDGFTVPTPTFTLTSSYTGTCASGAVVANDGMEGSADKSVVSSALGAGSYAYRGSVAGNDNYIGDDSDCEPFTVDKAQLSVTTVVHNAAHVDKTNAMVPLSSVMHDTATTTGAVEGFALPAVSFTLTGSYTGTCAAGNSVANNGTEGGYVKSADSSALTAGNYAYRAVVATDANYIGATGSCEPFRVINPHTTITITPNTLETLPGENVILTISDTNDGDVDLTDNTISLNFNGATTSYTHLSPEFDASSDTGADGIMSPGETWTWVITVLINSDTTFNVSGDGIDPLGTHVSPATGFSSEFGTVTVKVVGTTRTLGFWQTHTGFTSYVFGSASATPFFVGSGTHKGTLTSAGQVFGGFFAPIPKTSTGAKRSSEDQARITLLQQLLAAKLNCAAFGCSSAVQAQIIAADAAYAAGNKAAIMSFVSILDAYNNSGDANAIPSTLPATGKATPAASKTLADIPFWNLP